VTRVLHLGLTPWSMNPTTMPEQARLAQEWGYQSIWLPENHFSGLAAVPYPLMLLAGMAATTTRIKLGTTSYLLPLRHPLQAAEQVAVLDQLSAGRLILGLGRGYQAPTYSAFGIAMRQKREQQPHPPLWVAAFGPKALAQVGSLGLPYLASPVESYADLVANHAALASASLAAGHAQPEVVPVMRTMFVSDDTSLVTALRESLAAQIKAMAANGPAHLAKAAQAELDDIVIVGDATHVKAQVARYTEELGVTHLIATRLRLEGVDKEALRLSAQRLPEILGLC